MARDVSEAAGARNLFLRSSRGDIGVRRADRQNSDQVQRWGERPARRQSGSDALGWARSGIQAVAARAMGDDGRTLAASRRTTGDRPVLLRWSGSLRLA